MLSGLPLACSTATLLNSGSQATVRQVQNPISLLNIDQAAVPACGACVSYTAPGAYPGCCPADLQSRSTLSHDLSCCYALICPSPCGRCCSSSRRFQFLAQARSQYQLGWFLLVGLAPELEWRQLQPLPASEVVLAGAHKTNQDNITARQLLQLLPVQCLCKTHNQKLFCLWPVSFEVDRCWRAAQCCSTCHVAWGRALLKSIHPEAVLGAMTCGQWASSQAS